MKRSEAKKVIGKIRSRLGQQCIVSACSRDGCEVSTGGLTSPYVIADSDAESLDSAFEGKRPDFVLLHPAMRRGWYKVVAVPIELKSGTVDPVKAAEQLQGGATFADRIAPVSCQCRPVLIHGRGIPVRQLKTLNRQKISFRGRRLTILRSRCGEHRNLARALSS